MRRWFSLPRNERHLAVFAAAYVATAIAGLRIAGVRRMLDWADRPIGAGALAEDGIRDRVTAVARAGRYVPGGTCLPQSIALARMLRKNGVDAKVRLGVAVEKPFSAHAWVEIDSETPTANSQTTGFTPVW